MFGNVLGIAKRFASGSDIPIIAFIVLNPRIKEGTPDDFSVLVEGANPRLATHSVSG